MQRVVLRPLPSAVAVYPSKRVPPQQRGQPQTATRRPRARGQKVSVTLEMDNETLLQAIAVCCNCDDEKLSVCRYYVNDNEIRRRDGSKGNFNLACYRTLSHL